MAVEIGGGKGGEKAWVLQVDTARRSEVYGRAQLMGVKQTTRGIRFWKGRRVGRDKKDVDQVLPYCICYRYDL